MSHQIHYPDRLPVVAATGILNQKVRVAVGIIIMIAIAAIHFFRVGSYLNGNMYNLYYSFASDMMLPLGLLNTPCT